MKLGYVLVYVADVPRSVAFYERAFGLARRFVAEGDEYAEMETGATALGFVAAKLAGKNLPGGFRPNDPGSLPGAFEVAFVTDDVPTAHARAVAAGATEVSPPQPKPWGQIVSYVRDPDGLLVELATPMG